MRLRRQFSELFRGTVPRWYLGSGYVSIKVLSCLTPPAKLLSIFSDLPMLSHRDILYNLLSASRTCDVFLMFECCLSSTVSVSVPHPPGRSLIPVRNLIFCSLYTAILFFASLSSYFAIRCYVQYVFFTLLSLSCLSLLYPLLWPFQILFWNVPSMLHWYFYPTLCIYLDTPWIYAYIFRCVISCISYTSHLLYETCWTRLGSFQPIFSSELWC